ncbi:MAG: hypothetical protein Q8P07_05895 [bacterium]|nr:hypothetical protein [bacterium]
MNTKFLFAYLLFVFFAGAVSATAGENIFYLTEGYFQAEGRDKDDLTLMRDHQLYVKMRRGEKFRLAIKTVLFKESRGPNIRVDEKPCRLRIEIEENGAAVKRASFLLWSSNVAICDNIAVNELLQMPNEMPRGESRIIFSIAKGENQLFITRIRVHIS